MSSRDKFEIKAGSQSHNYQAGRNINQNFGTIVQLLAQSRLAQAAAIMTIVAGLVAVAQYATSLPANFRLSGANFRYNGDPGENDFQLIMQNQGPDNIRNLEWYAWLEGAPLDLKKILQSRTSIVARGDRYIAKNIGEGRIPADVSDSWRGKTPKVFVCLTYDGPLPATKQWMLLSGTHQSIGGYYSGNLTGVGGVPLQTVDTGGGLSLFSRGCRAA